MADARSYASLPNRPYIYANSENISKKTEYYNIKKRERGELYKKKAENGGRKTMA